MAIITLNTRHHGLRVFFMPEEGGTIRLESVGRRGTLGAEICERGLFTGKPISATPATFADTVAKWHKARLQEIRKYRGRYGA